MDADGSCNFYGSVQRLLTSPITHSQHLSHRHTGAWDLRGPPFNLQRGGGRVSGMDRNIFFTIIQQIIFSQLLGHQIIYFTSTLELFQLFFEGNYLFQQLAATNYLFCHLRALNYLFQKYPSSPWRLNIGPFIICRLTGACGCFGCK